MKLIRNIRSISYLVVMAAALAISASSSNAQPGYQGKFTLPFEVQWGGATLPAGDYTFSMEASVTAPNVLFIRGAKSAIVLSTTTDQVPARAHSQLDLEAVDGRYAVDRLEAPELGVAFVYLTPKAKNRMAPSQAAIPAAISVEVAATR